MKGSLAQGVLPGVLRELYVGRKSGLLHFNQPPAQRSVRFRKGNIVHAVSSIETERLGPVLLGLGLVSAENLEGASALVSSGQKRLGQALVELAVMDRAGLEDALAAHVREVLLKVFASHEGEYSFEELDVAPGADDEMTLRLSTGEMILEAVRLVHDPEAIRHGLGDVGRFLGPASDPLLRFQKLSLSPVDAFLLSRIDGTLTADEVLELAPVGSEEAERSLLGLLSTGMVQYRTDKPKPSRRFPTVRKRLATMRFAVKDMASALTRPPADAVATAATMPARAASPPPPVSPPPTAPAASAPAAAPQAPIPQGAATRPAAAAAKPAPVAASPSADESARAAGERREEILELYANLKTRNHFEILGISRASRDADVKEAYFRLARRFHPDTHHDASLHDLAEQIEAIFIRIGEAYDTLRNAKARVAYEERLGPSRGAPLRGTSAQPSPAPAGAASAQAEAAPAAPASPAPTMPLGEALRLAEMRFAEEKYFDVIQMLEPYVETTKGRGLQKVRLLLARAYVKNPNWAKRAEEELQKVVRDDPANTEAYLQLAGIYKGSGLKTRAASMLRKVVEHDPDNLAVQKELDALLPGEHAPEPEKGGLLKKLFGKG